MRGRTPEGEREGGARHGGIAAVVLGIVFIIGGWWGASGPTVIVDALSFVISGGLLGLGFIVIGAALFVRYSTTRYLRYWLVRQMYEGQANTDRIVEATTGVQQSIDRSRLRKKTSGTANTITPSSPAG